MKPIQNAGIIGCGKVALSHLKGYQENGINVSAVFDIVADKARAFAVQANGAHCYPSAEALLAESGVDAISICTPPALHKEVAIAALQRGIHVLCEKPMAVSPEECRQIEEAAQQSNAIFMMAFRHRFLPAHRFIKEFIRKENLGRIILFYNTFGGPAQKMKDTWFCRKALAGGGVIMDTTVHGIDLFRYYCGEIRQAVALAQRDFDGTDVEDTGIVSVKAESGTLGMLAGSWNLPTGVAIVDILTERARITYDYTNPRIITVVRAGSTEKQEIPIEYTSGFAEQIRHFLDAAASGTVPLVTAFDGRRAVEIATSILC